MTGGTEPCRSWPVLTLPLAQMFLFCSYELMERIDPDHLSEIILSAPAWARIGITVRDTRLRERAADALAEEIIERIEQPPARPHRDQLKLRF